MKNVMSWISRPPSLFLLLSIVLLAVGWKFKSFALIGFSGSAFLIACALLSVRLRGFLTPLVAIALVLSIAELLLPSLLPSPGSQTRFDQNSGYLHEYTEQVPGFGPRPLPGSYTSKKLTISDEVIYDVVYNIGPDGYRLDGASASPRVYVYGGSFAFGEGLDDDETLSAVLEAEHGVPAKSIAVQGYGLHQALYNIQNGITPEAGGVHVLLTAPWHALRSACKPEYVVGSPRYVLNDDGLQLDGVCPPPGALARLLDLSNIWRVIDRALLNTRNRLSDEDIALYLAIVEEIARLTHQHGSKLVVAHIDATEQQLSSTSWTNQTIMEHMSGAADSVVDVTLAETREALDARYYLSEFDQHPSAAANRERAGLIADVLK